MDSLKLKDLLLELVEELRIARITISENEIRLKELVEECHEKERKLEKEISRHQSLCDEQAESVDNVRRGLHDKLKFLEAEKNKLQLASEGWERETKTLKDDVRNLQLSKYNLEKTIREQAHRLQTQGQTKNAHTEQLADMETRCKNIQKQMASYSDMLDTLKKDVGEASRLNKSLAFSNDHQECQILSLRAKLEEGREEAVRLRVKLANQPEGVAAGQREASLRIEQLQREVQQIRDANKVLEKQFEETRSYQQTTQAQLSEAQGLCQRFQQSSNEMAAKMSERDGQIGALEEKSRMLQEELSKMSSDSSGLMEKLDAIRKVKEDEASDLRNEIHKLKEELSSAQKAGSNLEEINATWASKNHTLTDDIHKLQTELEKKDSDVEKQALEKADMLLDNGTQTIAVELADACCFTDDLMIDKSQETRNEKDSEQVPTMLDKPDASGDHQKSIEKDTVVIAGSGNEIHHLSDDVIVNDGIQPNASPAIVIDGIQPKASPATVIDGIQPKASPAIVIDEIQQIVSPASAPVVVEEHFVMSVEDSPPTEEEASIDDHPVTDDHRIFKEATVKSTKKESEHKKGIADALDNVHTSSFDPMEKERKKDASSQQLNDGDQKRIDEHSNVNAIQNKLSTSNERVLADRDGNVSGVIDSTTSVPSNSKVEIEEKPAYNSSPQKHEELPVLVQNVNAIQQKQSASVGNTEALLKDLGVKMKQNVSPLSDEKRDVNHAPKDARNTGDTKDVTGDLRFSEGGCLTRISSRGELSSGGLCEEVLPKPVDDHTSSVPSAYPTKIASTVPAVDKDNSSRGLTELEANTSICSIGQQELDQRINDIIPSTYNRQEYNATVGGLGKTTQAYEAPDLKVTVRNNGGAGESQQQKMQVTENCNAGGDNLLTGGFPKRIVQELDNIPTTELRSFGGGNIRTPRLPKAACLGPQRRVPSLELPHSTALQNLCRVSATEKTTQISKTSAMSYSQPTGQGKFETSMSMMSLFPSLRKRNLPTGTSLAPFSPGQREDQQPPIKIAANESRLTPLQTADLLHCSLQEFSQVSGQKPIVKHAGQADTQLGQFQRSIHSTTSVQPRKEMFGFKISSENFGIRENKASVSRKVTESKSTTLTPDSAVTSSPMTIVAKGSMTYQGGAADGEVCLFSDDDEDGDMKEGMASQIERIQTFLRKDRLTRSKKDGL